MSESPEINLIVNQLVSYLSENNYESEFKFISTTNIVNPNQK